MLTWDSGEAQASYRVFLWGRGWGRGGGRPAGDCLGGTMGLHEGGDDGNGGQGHLLAPPRHAALHHQHQLLPPLHRKERSFWVSSNKYACFSKDANVTHPPSINFMAEVSHSLPSQLMHICEDCWQLPKRHLFRFVFSIPCHPQKHDKRVSLWARA